MYKRLTEFRQALNLSKSEVAKTIGLCSSSYCDIENGKAPITERTIIAICSKYNVNEEWLRTGTGEMFNIHDKQFNEFFEIYQKLSKPLQDYLLHCANDLELQKKL